MKLQISKLWYVAGASIIVIAAFVLMLPAFINYTASLWQTGLLISITLLVAWIATLACAKLTGGLKGRRSAMTVKKNKITLESFALLALLAIPSMQAQVKQSEMSSFYQRPDTMHGKTVLIPAGTTFEGRIDTTISSRDRAGQSFSIVLASPLIANGVDVIIPAGAQVLGEVVEAIPSGALPRKKGQPKPVGKLRVQLTTLKMPDGMTYPFVGSIIGETIGTAKNAKSNPQLGGGVAFMGSQSSFAQVAPQALNRNYGNMRKSELLRHPLYGRDQENRNSSGKQIIRSLVRKGNNLYILAGSPLTVHLDAPFKLGIPSAPIGTTLLAPTFGQAELESGVRSKRRFTRTGNTPNNNDGSARNASPINVPASPQQNPLPGILPDSPSNVQTGAGELIPTSRASAPGSTPNGVTGSDIISRTGAPAKDNSNQPLPQPNSNTQQHQSQEDF